MTSLPFDMYILFFAVPAISAELIRVNSDRLQHIIQTMIAQRGEV